MSPEVIDQMILLFGYIAVGYGCNKFGIFDEAVNKKLSGFLLKVTIPATILASAFQQAGLEAAVIGQALAVAAAVFLVMILLSKGIAGMFHWEGTCELMMTYGNQAFMGLPIVRSVCGEEAVFYVVVFIMVFNLYIFTSGIMTLHGRLDKPGEMVKKLANPGILSALIAFGIVFTGLQAPAPLVDLAHGVGSITTPLAMMVIGSQVAQVDLKKVMTRWEFYVISLVKLVVFPLVVYLLLSVAVQEELLVRVAVLLTGMPIAGNVTMLCSEYGGNTSLTAQGTCVCTLLSLISLPIWIRFLM